MTPPPGRTGRHALDLERRLVEAIGSASETEAVRRCSLLVAILTLWRVVAGPTPLDRAIAPDVIVAIAIAAVAPDCHRR